MANRTLVVRWTIGNVSASGFESLRLSLWGARRAFGPEARLVVCVNSVPLNQAKSLTGDVPAETEWQAVTRSFPNFLRKHLDDNLAEGVGWKFAPLRIAPDAYELALDNDCILWEQPNAVREWLAGDDPLAVLAEDERRMLGQFSDLCGPEPRNSGIRGLPPGFDLGRALRTVLQEHPAVMASELDEQGLQVAALTRSLDTRIVTTREVTICSPFPPHQPRLGTCGAHFVGLNARQLPWDYDGRPAADCIRQHWLGHRARIQALVAAASPESFPSLASST
jgi:hypothetical protein